MMAAGAVGVAMVGSGLLFFNQPELLGGPKEITVQVPIKQVSEEVFDTSDNLFVIFLESAEELEARQADIEKVIRAAKAEPSLHRVAYYYNARKEGDPPIPQGDGPEPKEGTAPPLQCVLYKGQRKSVLRVPVEELDLEPIKAFFEVTVEKVSKELRELPVGRVSAATFSEDVLAGSSVAEPVLMQMYEDTCFLCFLMRPFINSLGVLLKEHKVPLRIKRLNIERNDFPDGCPVARGTPTFVLFCGSDFEPHKWDEFKPKELVERLSKDFAQFLPDSLLDTLDEYQGLVSKRFQLFTQLVLWTIELQKLESILSAATPGMPAAEGSDEEESTFGAVVAEMMGKDMQRTDLLMENIEYLTKEIDEAEHDAVLLGVNLAEQVMLREMVDAEAAAAEAKKRRR